MKCLSKSFTNVVIWALSAFLLLIIVVDQSLSHVQLFCNPMDCNLQGSSVYRIFQATILERVATSLSRGIFPNEVSNPCLLNWQVDSLPLNHQGSPLLIMEVLSIHWIKILCQIYESQIFVPNWSMFPFS